MSFFAVTIEEIATLRPHGNADRLDIAGLNGIGFQFIVAKGSCHVGDRCLYFPLDAILPESVLTKLGLKGKLAGAQRNRVKTIKLRGEISQGLVGPPSLIDDLPETERTPEKITAFLGVTKYEPEIDLPISRDASLIELPRGVGIYDIENCERFPDAVAELMSLPVWITEKLDGSHFALTIIDGREWVCQRRFAIEVKAEKGTHFFWEVAEKQGVFKLARAFYKELGVGHLVLRGEIIGPNIQSNIYYLKERLIKFYDLQANHSYLDVAPLLKLFRDHNAETMLVPTFALDVTLGDWLGTLTLPLAAGGESAFHKTEREGIVIRPMQGRGHPELGGRLILKQINPEFLAKQK